MLSRWTAETHYCTIVTLKAPLFKKLVMFLVWKRVQERDFSGRSYFSRTSFGTVSLFSYFADSVFCEKISQVNHLLPMRDQKFPFRGTPIDRLRNQLIRRNGSLRADLSLSCPQFKRCSHVPPYKVRCSLQPKMSLPKCQRHKTVHETDESPVAASTIGNPSCSKRLS